MSSTTTNPAVPVGKVLDYQVKQVCFNVYSYFKKRKRDPSTAEYHNDINLINTVSEVTGLSKSSVIRIVKQGNQLALDTGVGMFKPEEKKKHVRKKRIAVDKFTEGIIRRKVIQFYTVKKEVPSIRRLNQLLKEENILSCSNEYLRQMLHKLGFTNSDSGESKGMIMERSDIVIERFKYLKAIFQYRAQNRSLFFLNETKRWDEELDENDTSKISEMQHMPTLIIVHASVGDGFIDGSLSMLKLKSKKSKKNDLGYEQFDNYDWIKEHVTPNLAPSSVIVMNIPPFEESALDKDPRPISSSTRRAMQEWLDRHNITYRATDSKAELLQLINDVEKGKEYSIEKALQENGHTIVHLPKNNPDLNPVLVAWEGLKSELEDKTPNSLFRNYSKEDWAKCFNLVKESETEYYENDMKLDEAVTNLVSVKREHNSGEAEEDITLDFSCSDNDSA